MINISASEFALGKGLPKTSLLVDALRASQSETCNASPLLRPMREERSVQLLSKGGAGLADILNMLISCKVRPELFVSTYQERDATFRVEPQFGPVSRQAKGTNFESSRLGVSLRVKIRLE
jgi:hypothetical protein